MATALSPVEVSCPVCGGGMYDNRGTKKNPKQPDFKCKRYKEGCEGVIWPPKVKKDAPKPVSQGHPEFLANQEAEDAAELAGKIGPPDKPKLTKLYLDATEFVVMKILPLYAEAGVAVDATSVAAMVATLFIAGSKER